MIKYVPFCLLIFSIGCAPSGKPNLTPVSGTVLFEGAPLSQGSISFVPVNPEGSSASALIQMDGTFEMGTFTKGDGVVPGEYKVAITANYPVSDEEIAQSETGMVEPKLMTPEKYISPETSGLTSTVGDDQDEVILEFVLE